MYEIAIEETFDSAHCLPDDSGACRRLHGHTYRVRAAFRCLDLDESGMAVDFRRVKTVLREVVGYLDHQYINDLPEFSSQNPTAENIARFIYEQMRAQGLPIFSTTVWETPTSCATYFDEGL